MALRQRSILAAIGLLALALLVGLSAGGAVPADAAKKRAACQRWGKVAPTDLQVDEARKAILCLLNKKRANAGLKELTRDKRLQEAAQRHNDRLDGTGCFEHECPGEPDLEARLQGISYLLGNLLRWAIGENIAWGEAERGTPKSIVGAWMNSHGHRANILNPSFREVGVGFSPGTPSDGNANGGIYTTDFGLAVD